MSTNSGEYHLRNYSLNNFEALYRRMETDFPPDEMASKARLAKLLDNGEYQAIELLDSDGPCAYTVYNDKTDDVFVAYLATYADRRGKGVGSELLSQLKEKFFEGHASIILEVEHPDFAGDAQQKKLRERRIDFYKRAGFVLVDDVFYSLYGVKMLMMILPLQDSFEAVRARITQRIPEIYSRLLTPRGMRQSQMIIRQTSMRKGVRRKDLVKRAV